MGAGTLRVEAESQQQLAAANRLPAVPWSISPTPSSGLRRELPGRLLELLVLLADPTLAGLRGFAVTGWDGRAFGWTRAH